MSSKEEYLEKLEELRKDHKELLEKMNDIYPSEGEIESKYIKRLNSEGTVKIGNIEFDRADILKTMDPTIYNVGLNDFERDYIESRRDIQILQNKIDDSEEEIADIEEELL